MKTLVIAAHNNENLDWRHKAEYRGWSILVNALRRPMGRESQTILQYILDHNIPDEEEVVFCQGDPFDHDLDFVDHLDDPGRIHFGPIHECDCNSGPSYEENLSGWCNVLGLHMPSYLWHFSAGSQYRLTGTQIHSRPLEMYKSMLALTHSNPKAPWVYERLWPIIWGITL